MRKRHVTLFAGLLGAGAIAAFGDRTPKDSVVETVSHGRSHPVPSAYRVNTPTSQLAAQVLASNEAPQTSGGSRKAPSTAAILKIVPRSEADTPASPNAAESLFRSQTWVPPPPPPPPPAKPTAPPLPFSYLGKQQESGVWMVFLNRDGTTLVLKTGDQVDGAYQVVAISPPTMTFRYMPLNESQSLTIE